MSDYNGDMSTMHYNLHSRKPYTNKNAANMDAIVKERNYPTTDGFHLWTTIAQLNKSHKENADAVNYYVRKGEKGLRITYCKDDDAMRKVPRPEFGSATVFHLSQLEIKPRKATIDKAIDAVWSHAKKELIK